MLPWHDTIRRLTASQRMHPDGTLWVIFSKSPDELGPFFEALDLLMLFAHTHPDAWRRELARIWPTECDRKWSSVLQDCSMPRQIHISLDVCGSWKEPAAVELQALQTGAYVCSAEYQRARERLEGEVTTHKSTANNSSGASRPRLSVRLTSQENNRQKKSSALVRFMKFFPPRKTSQSPNGTNAHSLWSHVALEWTVRWTVTTTDELRCMHHAAQCGVHVVASALNVKLGESGGTNVSTVEAVRWACSTVQEPLPLPGSHSHVLGSPDAKPAVAPFQDVTIRVSDPPDSVASFLSAIQASASLTHATVESPLANDVAAAHQRTAWRWFAYVFLSRHANPAVRNLSLSIKYFSLTIANVADMRNIALAGDPLAALFEVPAVSHPDFVRGSAFRLVDPALGDPSTALLRTPAPIPVRVIAMLTDGWWRVLLPGKGQAWLHERDRVEDVSAVGGDDPVPLNDHVRVELRELGAESMEPAGSMLQLLGERVQILTVTGSSSWSDDGWCRRVLESCSRVETLSLNGGIEVDGEAVVEWYTSGACKATSLSIRMTQHAASLLNALSDVSLPLAAHIRVLGLTASLHTDRRGVMAVVDAGLCTLATNRRLQMFMMNLTVNRHLLKELKVTSIEASYHAHDGELLPVHERPIDPPAKAAFLSVLRSSVTAAGQWLDSGVVARIFDFAAVCRTRLVSVDISAP